MRTLPTPLINPSISSELSVPSGTTLLTGGCEHAIEAVDEV